MKPTSIALCILFPFSIYCQNLLLIDESNPKSHLIKELRKTRSQTSQESFKTTGNYLAKMTGQKSFSKDSTGTYHLKSKTELTYNGQEQSVKTMNYSWDGSTFSPSSSDTTAYNSAGKVTYLEVFKYMSQVKTPAQRATNTYDANQNKLTELLEFYLGSAYDTASYEVFHYTNNRLDSAEFYLKPNNYSVTVYKYDLNNNLVEESSYNLNSGNRVLSSTYYYAYYSNNTLAKRYYLNTFSGDTTNTRAYHYTTSGLDSLWDYQQKDSLGVFQPSITYNWTYDANLNEDEHFVYRYDNTQAYLWYYAHVYVDTTIDIQDVLNRTGFIEGFTSLNHKVDAITFKLDQPPFSFDDSVHYDYEVYIGLDEERNMNSFLVYPNPNEGHFEIVVSKPCLITITDISGKTIYSKKLLVGENKVELSNYDDGIYVIKGIG